MEQIKRHEEIRDMFTGSTTKIENKKTQIGFKFKRDEQ